MGNSIGGKRKGAKVMQLDGTSFRVKPPAVAADVLRDHPGVPAAGVGGGEAPRRAGPAAWARRAAPKRKALLPRWAPATPGRGAAATPFIRFGPEFPRFPGRVGSGAANPVRLKMRLPRAQVEKLMGESKDASEAAAKIMELCAAAGAKSASVTPERPPGILRSPRFAATPEWGAGFMVPPPAPGAAKTPQRWPTLPRTKEKKARFVALPDELIA
ncbi:hypothetical protein OsJ_08272 [Oryza sativa Japonica Group]|uniref:Uncharacterized protein n=1 Tax=Oryza sativa subsp. japonica TaxID=39947 RepID=B9F2J8_ORYSJ|nr:hypothetical protein OsJ_08272 [Oryza sativa Japonica Group]